MSYDFLEGGAVDPSRPRQIRNPIHLNIRREASRIQVEAANGAGVSLYLEAFGLGCLITAIAAVLPLVMLLHR